MSKPMMKCGHAANARHMPDDTPSCAICAPDPQAYEIDPNPPDLSGRTSKCGYCENIQPSSPDLAFFEYSHNWHYDRYYCGCRGWD